MTNRRCYRVSIIVVSIVLTLAHRAETQTADAPRCGTGVHEAGATGTVLFPQDHIFCPLLADPKEVRSFVTFLRGTFPQSPTHRVRELRLRPLAWATASGSYGREGRPPAKACSSTWSEASSRNSTLELRRTISSTRTMSSAHHWRFGGAASVCARGYTIRARTSATSTS